MNKVHYDYIIVGAGAAGIQLALAMQRDSFFDQFSILLLDKSNKAQNDKTWSYWEKGSGPWDEIMYKSWSQSTFYGQSGQEYHFNLDPYIYKSVRSIDFYSYAQSALQKSTTIEWLTDEVLNIEENPNESNVRVSTATRIFTCTHCFDSRIENEWQTSNSNKHVTLWQHFKGWVIECDQAVFSAKEFTMMDFRLRHKDSTSFTYVLPISESRALIEFTLFTKERFERSDDYDSFLQQYIQKYITTDPYTIVDTEEGFIPMSNYPFHKHSTKRITKIGTAGSWVRPSTGYSFHYIGKYVSKLLQNIKSNKHPSHSLLSAKTNWLDSVFLEVLDKENHLGPAIFETQYSKNSIQQIFKFLDGETSVWEDAKMILSFEKRPFLLAACRQLLSNRKLINLK